MATYRKSTKSTNRRPDPAPTAEGLTRSLSESAQQIWLAGMGAFGRAQSEGTKLFEALVKEGLTLEQTARKLAGGQADAVRDVLESQVDTARTRAADTWDRLEKALEDRVQRAMGRLGVPSHDDLDQLSRRVDALSAQLRHSNRSTPTATPRARAPGKMPAKTAAKTPLKRAARPAAAAAKSARPPAAATSAKAPAKRVRRTPSTPAGY